MKYTLHKLPEGFIITSDEKPVKDDLCFDLDGNPGYNNQLYVVKCLRTADDSYWVKNTKKIIALQDQIDFSALLEDEQKRIGWFDVEKICNRLFGGSYEKRDVESEEEANKHISFGIECFQKAQELLSDRRFTLEDLEKVWKAATNKSYAWLDTEEDKKVPDFEETIQSLSQPKSWQVELEIEEYGTVMEDFKDVNYRPKFTNDKIKILKIL